MAKDAFVWEDRGTKNVNHALTDYFLNFKFGSESTQRKNGFFGRTLDALVLDIQQWTGGLHSFVSSSLTLNRQG
jgi:hypothetical protein